ncbi:MAG: VOC family protein [Sphingobium sp.]
MTAAPYIWYELMTTDVAAAKEFYGNVAGWSFADNGQSALPYTHISAGDDQVGGLMALTGEAAANGARPAWFGYIKVDDVDATVAAIVADGGTVHMPPTDVPVAGRIAMVTDPQSVPFYVIAPDGEGESKAFLSVPTLGHFAWNELYAGDLTTVLPFYQKHFGWEMLDAMDMGPMGQYQIYGLDDGTGLGGMMTKPAEMPRPMWLYYIGVEDCDAALQRATDAGANIIHGPSEVPGGLFIFQGIDPQGAMFACVGPKV